MFAVSRFARLLAPAAVAAVLAVPAQAQGFKLTLAPEGNTARFITQETFKDVPTPFEPVGVTNAVTGMIVFGADGKVDSKQSKITVDLTGLKTDNNMRDGQIRRQSLQTEQFPNAVLVPTAVVGLASPIPATGALTFSLIGDLTLHGVTKPTTWTVTATGKDGKYTGKAKTTVRFDHFNITKPSSMRVLSIVDEVRLEYDFVFVRETVK